jgi:large-conductance mechanosensitive channel
MEAENYYSNQSQSTLNNMNTVVQSALPQDQTQTTNNSNSNSNSNSKKNQTFRQNMNIFLNMNATTILTTAIGMSIGFAFKDLITSLAINVIQPLIYKIVTKFDSNNYLNLQTLLTDNHTNFNFTTFAMALITFIIIFVSDYFINQNIGKIV